MKIIFTQFIFLSFLLFIPILTKAQDYPLKREFRGVWIASVENVDWPSVQGLSSEEQQNEFRKLLSIHRRNGFNAVFVQIRPSADALYDSQHEPWSRWLTGKEGNKPNPFYDPLSFMIRECRYQGMEFHAWINPFRAVFDFKNVDMDSSHLFYKNPEWMLTYGKHVYLDPGTPQVREYVLDVVMDIVNRYEVDGIHFDDYFYPYHADSLEFPDETTFKLYGEGFEDKKHWRRQNINLFVKSVYDSIQATKPEVKFGISPFRTLHYIDDDSLSSLSLLDQTNYEGLFTDMITWLQQGWVDYIVPLLHFGAEYSSVDYRELLSKWGQNTYGKHLYVGQEVYKAESNSDLKSTSLLEKMRMEQKNFQVDGNIFFSSHAGLQKLQSNYDSLQLKYYKHCALVPAMTWKPGQTPDPPFNIKVARKKNEVLVQWESNIHQSNRYYVVYLQDGNEPPNISNSKCIVGKTSEKHFSFLEKKTGLFRKKHCLVVTAVDQQHRESLPSQPTMIWLHDD